MKTRCSTVLMSRNVSQYHILSKYGRQMNIPSNAYPCNIIAKYPEKHPNDVSVFRVVVNKNTLHLKAKVVPTSLVHLEVRMKATVNLLKLNYINRTKLNERIQGSVLNLNNMQSRVGYENSFSNAKIAPE